MVNGLLMGGQTGLSALVKNEAPLRWFLEHGADPNLGPPVDLRPDSVTHFEFWLCAQLRGFCRYA